MRENLIKKAEERNAAAAEVQKAQGQEGQGMGGDLHPLAIARVQMFMPTAPATDGPAGSAPGPREYSFPFPRLLSRRAFADLALIRHSAVVHEPADSLAVRLARPAEQDQRSPLFLRPLRSRRCFCAARRARCGATRHQAPARLVRLHQRSSSTTRAGAAAEHDGRSGGNRPHSSRCEEGNASAQARKGRGCGARA